MLVSHNWLQNYFDSPLPAPEKLAELFTFRIFEVESVEKKGNDTVYDLKVLPDRAHYCLCHEGIAGEVSAMTGLPLKKIEVAEVPVGKTRELTVKIEDGKACRRYIGRVIENVKVGESPEWLKESLASLGQRSINAVVDASNCVMFTNGNPTHAFDADKVKGGIVVRYAKEGEQIVTLDNKDVKLSPAILIIADEAGPLAIAGVKGGKRAEVDSHTKNLILECANFEPTLTRRSATKLGIKTDASKRFENEIVEDKAAEAMVHLSSLVVHLAGGTAGPIVDEYPSQRSDWNVMLLPQYVSDRLGVSVSEKEIITILESLQMKVEKKGTELMVKPPRARLDCVIADDLVEEIGRLYGYEKIAGATLPATAFKAKQNLHFAATNLLREIFVAHGFSEMYGYALTDKGDVVLANPLASDKGALRTDLSAGMTALLKQNLNHVLLDRDAVKLFEVGTIFPKEGEKLSVAFGAQYKNKKLNKSKEDAAAVLVAIEQKFGTKVPAAATRSETDAATVIEFALDDLVAGLKTIPEADLAPFMHPSAHFKPMSLYPRIVRDVALFVPAKTDTDVVAVTIRTAAGKLLAEGPVLFDRFEKGEKLSLAYRMAFQSYEKTLSDADANDAMNSIVASLEKQGFEVRK